jgi:hypothetical protein
MPLKSRADKAELKSRLLAMARLHEDVLEANELGRGMVRAPEKLTKRRTALGRSEYRNDQADNYDWFYGLSRNEQSRLRRSWFAPATDYKGEKTKARSIDELEEKMSIKDWLEHTRGADANRALANGKSVTSSRFGGLSASRLRKDQEHRPDADGTTFYTNSEGEVIPISPPRLSKRRFGYGTKGYRPEDDEAF